MSRDHDISTKFACVGAVHFVPMLLKKNLVHEAMSSDKTVSNVKLEKLVDARFVRPFAMSFKMGEKERKW